MKVAFWLTSTTRHVTKENWGKILMGGAEISAVNLGRELDCDITYYLQRCEPFDSGNIHIRQHPQVIGVDHDVFICVRPHTILHPKSRLKAQKRVLWSGDAYDQPSNEIFYDRDIVDNVDAFVFKTKWQRDKILIKYYTIEKDHTYVIYNGVNGRYFKNLDQVPSRNRFIHASTWYRGLSNFIDLWPIIKEKIPDAELHVFSKTSLYSDNNDKMGGYYDITEKLSQYSGIILREPVPQRILAEEMRKSWLMLYPNTGFIESSCGSALQSITAGTPVISTARAGLIETVGSYGILVDGDNWKNKFVEGVVKLWENPKVRNRLGEVGRKQLLQNQTWEHKAVEWLNFLKSL